MPKQAMATSMTMPTAEALLRLLTWLSPAFPTGAFAYSHGLEWAVEAGDVTCEASLHGWLRDMLHHGSARTDAILLRHAWRAPDAAALGQVAELAAGCAPGRERQAETLAQGAAFCLAAAAWPAPALDGLRARAEGRIAYPVAVGTVASAQRVPQDATCQAFLHAVVANLVSAGVRLVPLGQSAGLRILAALEPDMLQVARETRVASLEDIGGTCLRADIAAMRHETQYTRLFRS